MSSRELRIANGSIAVRVAGSGPPVVLIHGNSCSSRAFSRQLEGELADELRLLAIDLPGHGDSAPATGGYSLPGFAATLVQCVAELDAHDAVIVGWSLGGHIAIEAAGQLPRAAGFLVFGTPPLASPGDMARAFNPNAPVAAGFRDRSTDEEIDALLACYFRSGTPVPSQFREDFLRTDGRFRADLGDGVARGDLADEIEMVRTLKRPLAILHGAHDAIVRRAYFDGLPMPTLWRGAVQEIPDAGHAPHWECPHAFDELLAAFARDARAG